MSIRIQLWKGDTQIGNDQIAPAPNVQNGISEQADAIVDQMLTAVHNGKHGAGNFRIEAEHIDARGVFLGSYHRSAFIFPRIREPACQNRA